MNKLDDLYLATIQDVKDQGLFYDYAKCPFRFTKIGRWYCDNRCQFKTSCQQHTTLETLEVTEQDFRNVTGLTGEEDWNEENRGI